MELLRRLRILWTASFVIIAALVGVAYMGNPAGVPLSWCFAALVAAVCFNIDGGLKLKLSMLWLGGFGLLAYGAFALDQYNADKALVKTLALTAVPWIAALIGVWLFSSLVKPKH